MPPTTFRTSRGFSLIEVMVVIALLVMLVALTVGVSRQIFADSAGRETAMTMDSLRNWLHEYRDAKGAYPPSSDWLGEIQKVSGSLEGKLPPNRCTIEGGKVTQVRDGWDNVINYSPDGGGGGPMVTDRYQKKNRVPILYSAGPDGQFGNADDVLNP